jgi:hypothetical protein
MQITFCIAICILLFPGSRCATRPSDTSHPDASQARDPDRQLSSADSTSNTGNSASPILRFGARELTSISPYRLAGIINQNKANWYKHQISEELNLEPIWNSLKIPAEDLHRCQADCESRTFPVALTGSTGKEVLLKITNSYFCRYLIFRPTRVRVRSRKPWRFLGYIDHENNKYEMSWHRTVANGNKHWLVIRGQTGSGTGFSSYEDTWYQVSGRGIKEVLEYTARAHIAQWPKGIGWDLNSTIITRDTSTAMSVAVRFRASFSGLNYATRRYPFLFSRSVTVLFKWDSSRQRFTFVPSSNPISRTIFESIYQGDKWSDEAFVKFNFSQLLLIANRGNTRQREWLKDFLNRYKVSREKTALLQTLGRFR